MDQQMISPARASFRPAPLLKRIVLHGALLAACGVISGAALVWPQWVALDGSRLALELQKEREGELTDRWEQSRLVSERLNSWRSSQRRVFLDEEAARYPLAVAAVGKKCGVAAQAAFVNQPSPRWRSASLAGGAWADGATADLGEIRPRSVKVTVSGSFEGVYKAVSTLCAQQQMFVPDRWTVVPANQPGAQPGSVVRAEIVGSVFVLRQAEPAHGPARTPAPLALRAELEGWNG